MMKRVLLTFVLLLIPLWLFAQTKVVSGEVVSAEDNQPIIGATVIVKGTKVGMVTNAEGKFQFNAPTSTKTLVVSYVGMQPKEVVSGTNLRIILRPDSKQLEEVVTVGYSKTTKRSFTGSATTVKAEALERKSVSNVSQALAGEVPGVTVLNSSGQPGSNAAVYVRGIGSVNASTGPLYVVDGIPYSGSISSINPADIESTTLLKDAASTAIYGARAANGVILITTKSGKAGNVHISADVKYGINTIWIPRYDVISNPDEYLEIGWESLRNYFLLDDKNSTADQLARQSASEALFGNEGINPKYNYYKEAGNQIVDPQTGRVRSGLTRKYTPENWFNESLQSSHRTEANVQLSGGTSKLKGFFSIGYLEDNGVAKNTDYQRLSSRVSIDFNPYSWIAVNARLGYTHSNSRADGQSPATTGNVFFYTNGMPPIYPVYERDSEGNKISSPYYEVSKYDYGIGRGFSGDTNPLADVAYNKSKSIGNQVDYNLGTTIRFLDGFSLENTLGGSYNNNFGYTRRNKWYGSSASIGGSISHGLSNSYNYDLLTLLRYSKSFGIHALEAFVAHEANGWTSTYSAADKKGLVDPFGDDLDNGVVINNTPYGYTDIVRIESYFLQANYNYSGKYFISGTFRRDGSSKFLNKKWGNFGSLGLAWVASEEPFFASVKKVIPYLKVKASYGTLGQQSGLSSDYVGRQRYSIDNHMDQPALILVAVDDPQLTWERSSMAQLGFEFNVGKFLTANLEFYQKRSSSLIYDRVLAPSRGYDVRKVNDGILENRGIDIDLTAHLLRQRDFNLDLRLNAGFLANRMVEMPIEPSTGQPKFIDTSTGYFGRQKDRSLYDYYIREFAGVDRETGQSLWTLYFNDIDKDGVYDKKKGDEPISSYEEYVHSHPEANIVKTTTKTRTEATRNYIGKSALPTVRGGINLSASYKGIELDVLFSYGLGGWGYDHTYATLMDNNPVGKYNWHTDIRKRWTPENKDTDIPRLNNENDQDVAKSSSRFLISNNFLHLANVRLGYNLPKYWLESIYLKGARIWVSGNNLALWSARRGFNPSMSLIGSSSNLSYNPVTSITAGLNLNF